MPEIYDFNRALRIGTRGSQLALTQTDMVVAELQMAHPKLDIDIITINTSGDWRKEHGEKRLEETAGGKGQFIKEIEMAIQEGFIDCGVHSMKDVPTDMPSGLSIDHVMERGDPRDAFLSFKADNLMALPEGCVVGTASPRRAAIIRKHRPDLKIAVLRGNIDTRISKLKNGQVDAAILAACGLQRVERAHDITEVLSTKMMLPAVGQGIVSIETRANDVAVRSLFDAIHHAPTGLCVTAERAALEALGGSCHTAIGSHAVFTSSGEMHMRCALYDEDTGAEFFEEKIALVKTDTQAYELGYAVGAAIRPRAPDRLFG